MAVHERHGRLSPKELSPRNLWTRYRASGADLPFGNPLAAHGVAMEGYFWRFTQPGTGRVVIALCGVNRADDSGGPGSHWATLGLAAHPGGFLRTAAHPVAASDPDRLGASAGDVFCGDSERVWMDLGDDARLRQVLSNLVTNALTHTPPDADVTVRVGTSDSDAILEVADTGPGLDPDDRERVFERFYRADASRTRASGGSGLGLSIVAALVAAHGGKVEVESEQGVGSTFRVRIPRLLPS